MTKYRILLITACLAVITFGCESIGYGEAVQQVKIERIESMPNLPSPYKILDWKEKAVAFDNYVFNFNTRVNDSPLIWIDNARRNIPQPTFGLYTAVNDARQGPLHNNGEFHESLNSLAAILGAGLVGIDKTSQNGYNYVKMVQNYFNSDTGWNIMMNNTCPDVALQGGGCGRDWWYDVFPNVLYYAVCDVFPGVEGADRIQRSIAEQFCKADSVLNGNYDYSFFDYGKMKGMVNQIPAQQDAAGGHAYVLYAAYKKYKDARYLRHAKNALNVLMGQKESRFYEILLPMSAIVAAHLNAEEGTNYDIKKIIDWTFNGCKNPKARYGWGVIEQRWGNYDVDGLQGCTLEGSEYGFLMNSIKLSWPLVPLVKYEPQFARAIGKWMLNNVNACRLFFPLEIDDEHQWCPEYKNITKGIVAYEGIRKSDDYGKSELKGISPVAIGDGPKWNAKNPPESMFSLYSTSPVGIFGAIVNTTNIKGILKLNCNATDFYANRPYPVFLYYNPYNKEQKVEYHSTSAVDLFDIVEKTYVAKGIKGKGEFSIPGDAARVIVELPARSTIRQNNKNNLMVNNNIIAYK